MKLTVRVFKIENLGYYKNNVRQNDLGDILALLNGWKEWGEEEFPKELETLNNNSKDIKELTSKDIDKLISSYLNLGEYKKDSGFLVSLWKGLPKSVYTKKVLNIKSNKLVVAYHNKYEIPGDPYYFWFIPDDLLLVAISPQNQSAATKVIRARFMDFLKNKSKYRVLNKNRVVGYSINGKHNPGCELVEPLFDFSPITYGSKKDEEEILISDMNLINATFVTRKIKTKDLNGFDSFGKTESIRTTIDSGFSEGELKDKFKEFYNLKENDEEITEIGFEYNNRRKALLTNLNSYMIFDLDIESNEEEGIDKNDFFKKILDRKKDIFRNMGDLNILKK